MAAAVMAFAIRASQARRLSDSWMKILAPTTRGSIATPRYCSARPRMAWKSPKPHADRGWVKLYCETVTQADRGVDLDFLVGNSGAKVGRESH